MRRKTIDFTLNNHTVYAFDFLDCFLTTDIIKRSFSTHQLIRKDSNAPNINPTVIRISFNNFRTDIVQCPTVSLPSIWTNGSPSKIAYFTDSLDIENQVHLKSQHFKVSNRDGQYYNHASILFLSISSLVFRLLLALRTFCSFSLKSTENPLPYIPPTCRNAPYRRSIRRFLPVLGDLSKVGFLFLG